MLESTSASISVKTTLGLRVIFPAAQYSDVKALWTSSNRTSAFLANPKNLDLAITALDITAPRQLKYIASEKLLRGLIGSSQNEDEKQFFEELQKMYKDNKEFIIDNMRVE